jgi:hypothetical protein
VFHTVMLAAGLPLGLYLVVLGYLIGKEKELW